MQTPLRSLLALAAVLVLAALGGCGGGRSASPPSTGSSGASSGGRVEEGGAEAGGEKSIEGFGQEAAGAERAAVLGAFTGYLNALAAKDYASACPHLAATVRHSLEQLAARPRTEGCAVILPKLLAPSAPAIAREQAEGRIAKVRVKVDRAFVVFHAPGAKLFQMPMVLEGGDWKAALVAASVLVPSAATLGQ